MEIHAQNKRCHSKQLEVECGFSDHQRSLRGRRGVGKGGFMGSKPGSSIGPCGEGPITWFSALLSPS